MNRPRSRRASRQLGDDRLVGLNEDQLNPPLAVLLREGLQEVGGRTINPGRGTASAGKQSEGSNASDPYHLFRANPTSRES